MKRTLAVFCALGFISWTASTAAVDKDALQKCVEGIAVIDAADLDEHQYYEILDEVQTTQSNRLQRNPIKKLKRQACKRGDVEAIILYDSGYTSTGSKTSVQRNYYTGEATGATTRQTGYRHASAFFVKWIDLQEYLRNASTVVLGQLRDGLEGEPDIDAVVLYLKIQEVQDKLDVTDDEEVTLAIVRYLGSNGHLDPEVLKALGIDLTPRPRQSTTLGTIQPAVF